MPLDSLFTSSAFINQALTAGSQTTSSLISSQAVAQGLLEIYGIRNIAPEIRATENTEEVAKQQVRLAIQTFAKSPSASSRDYLISMLEHDLGRIQKQHQYATEQRAFYQRQIDKSTIQSSVPASGYLKQWGKSALQSLKNFFGSTNSQQVEKYQGMINECGEAQKALSQYITELKTLEFETLGSDPAAPPFPTVISLSTLNSTTGFKIDAESLGDAAGSSLSAGDVDGDQFSDILIGAPSRNSHVGSAYLVRGSSNLGANGTVSLTPTSGGSVIRMDGEIPYGQETGSSVSVVGDVKGNGHASMLIGAPGYYADTGRSYLLYGGQALSDSNKIYLADLDGNNGKKIDGENIDDFAGTVGNAGDINGDGRPDFVIGAPGYGGTAGRGYALWGGSLDNNPKLSLTSLNGTDTGGYKVSVTASNSYGGYPITGIGDFNGDGYGDFAIGASFSNSNTGSVFVVYGGPDVGRNSPISVDTVGSYSGTRFDGENPGDYAGWSISSIPNQNRASDLIIGAPFHNKAGRTYILRGGHNYGAQFALGNLNQSLGNIIDGQSPGDNAGYSVSSIGDMEGNGSQYFAIGARGYNASTGRTYAVRYQANLGFYVNLSSLNGSNGFVVDGENPNDFSGSVVAAGGDIHGNRSANLLISAPGYNKAGRVYVVYGIPNGTTPTPPPLLSSNQDLAWLPYLSIPGGALAAGAASLAYRRYKRSPSTARPQNLDESTNSESKNSGNRPPASPRITGGVEMTEQSGQTGSGLGDTGGPTGNNNVTASSFLQNVSNNPKDEPAVEFGELMPVAEHMTNQPECEPSGAQNLIGDSSSYNSRLSSPSMANAIEAGVTMFHLSPVDVDKSFNIKNIEDPEKSKQQTELLKAKSYGSL